MLRKNEKMYVLSGGRTEGHKCAECSNLCTNTYDKVYYKCGLYGTSSCEATDWAKSYPACAWFNQERKERDLVKIRVYEPEEMQIDGQMSIEDFMRQEE